MRIGIDSRMISMTGIGTYLRNLIDGIGELDRENKFVLFMHGSSRIKRWCTRIEMIRILREHTDDLKGIVYGNSSYVIVGASGTILTSTNGTTWTSRTSGTSNDLKGVIYSQ